MNITLGKPRAYMSEY